MTEADVARSDNGRAAGQMGGGTLASGADAGPAGDDPEVASGYASAGMATEIEGEETRWATAVVAGEGQTDPADGA